MGRTDFSDQLRKVIRHKVLAIIIYYATVCMLRDLSVMVDIFFFTIESHTGGSDVRLYDGPDLKLIILVAWDRSSFFCCLGHRGSTDDLLLPISSGVVWQFRDLHLSRNTLYMYLFIVMTHRRVSGVSCELRKAN